MPADASPPSIQSRGHKVLLARRRLLIVGGNLAAAAALAACGDDGGKGSRDDPFPYQDPRSRNTRL